MVGLLPQLVGPDERKKERTDRSQVPVIKVSGNIFPLLSELLGLA